MSKRVLIVDDEADVLETLAELVSAGGYEVVTRTSFEEARKDITNDPPDILVTDVRLGPFNGLQLAVLMRAMRPDGPIIVLSAYDDPTLRIEAAHCQATYLTKPVSRKELLVSLAGISSRQPAMGPQSKRVH
jgi:DNA-binding response OmpR family regulator